jgi:dolichyl-phosphate beta-glucosyltransferase
VISLVLPAYNPGTTVERTWDAAREFLDRRSDPWEILIVCDGCTDGTPERLIERLRTEGDSRFKILHYAPNRGKGFAVRSGLLAARGTYRIFTDIDLAYSFADVVRVADALRGGAPIAIASREHPESLVQLPPRHLGYAYRRRVQSAVFGRLARMLLPIHNHDTQAGLKGMTAEIAQLVLPKMSCNGFGFDCELLTACARHDVAVSEIPVCVRLENADSTTGAGSTLRMLKELWRIRKNWSRKKPLPEAQPFPTDVTLDSVPASPNSHIRAA